MPRSHDQAVAVVGLGCVLPDAFGVEAFWNNSLSTHRALRAIDTPPRDWRRHLDLQGLDSNRSISIIAGLVEGWSFDWRRFRMPPTDVATINPLALMTVDAGAQALDAVERLPRSRTGVFLGATGFGWQSDSALRIRMGEITGALEDALAASNCRRELAAEVRTDLEQTLGPVTDDTIVNGPASVAAGRLAMLYDLRGLHYAIDAGFASALAALEVGVRALRDGSLDLALVGGASELLSPLDLVAFSRIGGLARRDVRPFDAEADGTLLGEGVAMFALKRLEDALRDGEQILAVVRGVGGASDGAGRSLLAPQPEGQARAMERAYRDAGVEPSTLAFVECHATGTKVGDRSELAALSRVIERREGVRLTSGKAAVGHLRGGAGAVGMLRAVLALKHGVLPRQPGFSRPSEALEESGFEVPLANTPLLPRSAPTVRAGVSAFGFGGIGYHAVLEAFDPEVHGLAPRRRSVPPPRVDPIAIVGLGGVFPGADDVPSFWKALLDGFDATREVPASRWDVDRYHDPDPARADTSYTRLGCFLERFPEVDPRWRIPPAALANLDPSHLVCLRAAEEALADAGVDADSWRERDEVAIMLAFLPYQGRKFLADLRVAFDKVLVALESRLASEGLDPASIERVCDAARERFFRDLPPLTEDTLTGYLGSLNAGRIARRFDLRGPHYVVDAACASTHAAVHAAVQALRHRTANWALTGGVWADIQPEFFVGACRFNALSATGSAPFDESADGFIPGEGGGVLVLRRLDDAIRDGQRVYAVIRGIAGASDGAGRSVLAPTTEGEVLAMQRALEEAQVEGADIGYVECHGTGTALGDVVEVDACSEVFGGGRKEPLRIGSVKSNFGHLNAAAGVPGIIKAALAVREGVIPPSLKVTVPNPRIDFQRGRVEVVREMTRWDRPAGGVRRAGVSSFGVGGASMHLILEEHRPSTRSERCAPPEEPPSLPPIARVAGADLVSCTRALNALFERYARGDSDELEASVGDGPVRVAVVAPSPEEFQRRLKLLSDAVARDRSLAYLRAQGIYVAQDGRPSVASFSGQGSHYANMARELAAAEPAVHETLEEADAAYRMLTGHNLRDSFWADDPDGWTQREQDIHCAVLAVNVALYRMLERRGFSPIALVGQSAGELSALVVAGSLSLTDGLRAVWERTRAVLEMPTSDPGRMIAVQADVERVRPLLEGLPGHASIAADNGPAASTVSVGARALDPMVRRLRDAGLEHSVLAVSHGYHSQLIASAVPAYRRALERLPFREPSRPIYSTVTGGPLSSIAIADLPVHLASQFVEPVRLRAAVEAAWQAGGRVFFECGPKRALTTFTEAILGEREHVAEATMHPKVGEREQAARAIACLMVHGQIRNPPVAYRRLLSDSAIFSVADRVEEPGPAPREILRGANAHIAELAARRGNEEPSRAELIAALRRLREVIDEVLGDNDQPEVVTASVAQGGEIFAHFASEASTVEHRAVVLQGPGTGPRSKAPASHASREELRGLDDLEARIVRAFASRTGYPEEMLERDLDLEADLGIDTVKQIAVIGELRTSLGLPTDANFELRKHPSIAALASYLRERLASVGKAPRAEDRHEPTSPRSESPAPRESRGSAKAPGTLRVENQERLVEAFARTTEYPEEMLEAELDLEADLGIDTVKSLGLPTDPEFELRRVGDHEGPAASAAPAPIFDADWSDADVTDTTVLTVRSPGTASSPYHPDAKLVSDGRLLELALAALEEGPMRLTDVRFEHPPLVPEAGQLILTTERRPEADGVEIRVRAEQSTRLRFAAGRLDGPAPNPKMPPELARIVADFDGSPNLTALAADLGRPVPADGGWAHAPRWDLVVGAVSIRKGPPPRRLADAIDAALFFASLAWMRGLGIPHLVRRIGLAALQPVAGGTSLHLVARMRSRRGGSARADVDLFAETGEALGQLSDVIGVAVAAPALDGSRGGEELARWQRMARRLVGDLSLDEDIGR